MSYDYTTPSINEREFLVRRVPSATLGNNAVDG